MEAQFKHLFLLSVEYEFIWDVMPLFLLHSAGGERASLPAPSMKCSQILGTMRLVLARM
jgi:hypothetical protein